MTSLLRFLLLCIELTSIHPTSTSYTCSTTNEIQVTFSLSNSTNSAFDSSTNCFLPICSTNNNESCRTSSTPCFDYRTRRNQRFCSPALLCSILEPCENVTGLCSSNSSICIENTCCSPSAVCLPLFLTDFCHSILSCEISWRTISSEFESSPPDKVFIADFNGDRRKDLAMLIENENSIRIYFSLENGTLSNEIRTTINVNSTILTIGDFNRDNRIDLISRTTNFQEIQLYLGFGNGTFQSSISISNGTNITAMVVDDFNRDDQMDLAIGDTYSQKMKILLGFANGSFTSEIITSIIGSIDKMFSGDVNGDQLIDLIVLNRMDNVVDIYFGFGNGSFRSPISSSAGGIFPTSISLGDFNNDSYVDIVFTVQNQISSLNVLLGFGNGSFFLEFSFDEVSSINLITTADFNNDDRTDFAAVDTNGNNIFLFLGDGKGNFTRQTIFTSAQRLIQLDHGDFNDDGRIDLVVFASSNNKTMTFLNLCQ